MLHTGSFEKLTGKVEVDETFKRRVKEHVAAGSALFSDELKSCQGLVVRAPRHSFAHPSQQLVELSR